MKFPLLMAALTLLAACATAPTPVSSPGHRVLGLYEITITTNGTPSSIKPLRGELSSQADIVTSQFAFTPVGLVAGLNDTGSRSRHFITSRYEVTNNSGSSVANLMLVALNRPTKYGGTAFKDITLSDDTASISASLARAILPAHGMRDVGGTLKVDPDFANLQVLPSSLSQSLTTSGHSSGVIDATDTLLDYAFTVRKTGTQTPGTLNTGETGKMAMAFSVPLQTPQVKSAVFTFALVSADRLTFTESLEHQAESDGEVDDALWAQANWRAQEVRTLPGSTRGATISGTTYTLARYPSARTALSSPGFARDLILTKAPQGIELSSSSTGSGCLNVMYCWGARMPRLSKPTNGQKRKSQKRHPDVLVQGLWSPFPPRCQPCRSQ